MFKKIALVTCLLSVLGIGTFALCYIPPGVNNCNQCMDYWQNRGYNCHSSYLRCYHYFDDCAYC